MGTNGRVPKTSVTSRNIRQVADISGNLGEGEVTSSQLFLDNDVKGEYIDPEYCSGATAPDRLAVFQDLPLHSGEWRNYGGEEAPLEGEPEIYFSSILGKGYNDGNLIEFIPTDINELAELIAEDMILGTSVPPNLDLIDDYTSSLVVASKVLVDATQSAMFRDGGDNVLNISDLAIQVGLDYTLPSSSDPRFSYNIEVYYGDIPRELQVQDAVTNTKKIKRIFNIAFYIGFFGSWGYFKGRVAAGQFWNYLKPNILKPAWTKIKGGIQAIERFAGTSVGSTLLPILTALASYTAMIMVANIIWNMSQVATKVVDGIYKYKNMVDGMYTWDDLKKTKYQIGFGRMFSGVENFISKLISPTTDSNIYTVPMNSIVYPLDDSAGRKRYANFKFFPKCTQYDLMTPPPIITFKIELAPISGCRLSQTKPTAFTISIAPDKYMAPIFDIIAEGKSASESLSPIEVYVNTPIVFKNARFVDFLALLDTEPSSGGLFGTFKIYEDRYINSDGDDMAEFNKYLPVIGNDVVTTGGIAFGGVSYPEGNPMISLYPAESIYEVKFMQEAQANIIRNPTFRLEQLSEDPDDETYLLRKFWNYDSSWEIRDGAIYRDSAGNQVDGFWQLIPEISEESHESRGRYYFMEIECVISSGYIELDLSNTFGPFLCNWLSTDSIYWHKKYSRSYLLARYARPLPDLLQGDYPNGMLHNSIDGRVRIITTGKYKVLLRTSTPTQRIFKIIPSEDFTGRVNYVSLINTPLMAVNDGRGAVNAVTLYNQPILQLKWTDSIRTEKTIRLNVTIGSSPTFTVKFKPIASEFQYYTVTINWGDGGSPTVYSDLLYQEYVESKDYYFPGAKTITITCSIPEANLQNLFETFTCNDSKLVRFADPLGLVSGGSIDLSGSSIGVADRIIQLYYMVTDSFTSPLYSLKINNTPISGNSDKLGSVTDYLDISNTRVSGDLNSLFHVAYLNASNSGITICSGVDVPTGADGNKTIIWKDCGVNVDQLYTLIHAIDVSSIEEGYLDIKGNNPIIADQDVLDTITMLTTPVGQPDGLGGIGRGWTVLFNAASYTLTVNNGTISSLPPDIPIGNVNFGYIYNNHTLSGSGSNSIISSDEWKVGTGSANNFSNSLQDYGELQKLSSNIGSKFLLSGSNEYGFNGKNAGVRYSDGIFNLPQHLQCIFSTINESTNIASRFASISIEWNFQYGDSFNLAMPVRLVNPTTLLTHGQTGTYTGNDGRVYPTICIGTQEWLSCNLAETELRDHTLIPTITDDAEWINNLNLLAKCAWNNDESNVLIQV